MYDEHEHSKPQIYFDFSRSDAIQMIMPFDFVVPVPEVCVRYEPVTGARLYDWRRITVGVPLHEDPTQTLPPRIHLPWNLLTNVVACNQLKMLLNRELFDEIWFMFENTMWHSLPLEPDTREHILELLKTEVAARQKQHERAK